MNKRLALALFLIAVLAAAGLAAYLNTGDRNPTQGTHRIELYSGGKRVGDWHAADTPMKPTEARQYWHFTDVDTGRTMDITGTVAVTRLAE